MMQYCGNRLHVQKYPFTGFSSGKKVPTISYVVLQRGRDVSVSLPAVA